MISLLHTLRQAPRAVISRAGSAPKRSRAPKQRPLSLSPSLVCCPDSGEHKEGENWLWGAAAIEEDNADRSENDHSSISVVFSPGADLLEQRRRVAAHSAPRPQQNQRRGQTVQPLFSANAEARQSPPSAQLQATRTQVAPPSRSMEEAHAQIVSLHTERSSQRNRRRLHVQEDRHGNATNNGSSDINHLVSAIRDKNEAKSMQLFYEMRENEAVSIPPQVAQRLFLILAKRMQQNLGSMGQIFHYLTTSDFELQDRKKMNLIIKMFDAIQCIDPSVHQADISYRVVEMVRSAIRQFDEDKQKYLLPHLLIAILKQRSAVTGRLGTNVYQDIKNLGMTTQPDQTNKILSESRFNRQLDVPFHEILYSAVQQQQTLPPQLVGTVIQNMFPFTTMGVASTAMQAFVKLQESSTEYSLSMDTLEMIANGAARSGCAETILAVWDVLEQSQMAPNASIYESTIIAFASNQKTVPNAFEAMSSMKAEGFPIHRALIRSFCTAIRSESINLRNALHFLQSEQGSRCLSVESLNVVLSGYAERSDVYLFEGVMDFMKRSDLIPDVETFSFAIEVLGKDAHRAVVKNKTRNFNSTLELAGKYLSQMEQQGIAPTSHVIRNYVELLCVVGELSTAVGVVEDILASDRPEIVNSKIIYRVVIACADNYRFDDARRLAVHVKDVDTLKSIIKSREQRKRHMELISNQTNYDTQGY